MEPNSTQNVLFQNWVRFHSNEDDHEALSLCDLVINKHNRHPEKQFSEEQNEDFDFSGRNLTNNKMCSADELFYQGQILPVNLPSGFMTRSKLYSRSEPVSVTSSRSSSTRSHNSGTSGSSSTSGSEFTGYKHTTRNQFHSYPSPKPQIRTRSFHQSSLKSSSKCSLLQLGPVKPQEIGLTDLRNRSQRSHASSGNTKGQNQKISQSHMLLFGGCNCKYSANVVESTVSLMVKATTNLKEEEETRLLWISKQNNDAVRRSSHSTSEWLNHLHFHATK